MPFDFYSQNPGSRKTCDNKKNQRFTMAQVDTNGKHGLFLHEQLVHLHIENIQAKLQT